MASVEEILLNFVGKDNVSNVQNRIKSGMNEIGSAASAANSKFKSMGDTAGQIGTKFTSGASKANSVMSQIGSTGTAAFRKVQSAGEGAIKSISSKLSGLKRQLQDIGDQMDASSSAIQGALGGIGFKEVATPVMEGAMGKEQREIQLTAKFGPDEAKRIQNQLAQIAAVTPGDDSVLKNILTKGAMDGNLTSMEQMKSIAQAYAGYAAGSAASGKQMAEVQRDINDYLFNGTTSVLEIDSIYRDHIDQLKGAKTVQERIEVINRLNKEHYNDILANSNSLNNVWQMFKGYITSAATDLGMTILPVVKLIVSGLLTLNELTGGWAFKIGIAVALVGTAGLAVLGTVGILLSGVASLIGMVGTLGVAATGWATGAAIAGGATFSWSLALGVLKAAVISFFMTNPIGWLILIIGAIVTLITVTGKWGDVINWLKGAWNNLVNWGGWKVLEDRINGLIAGAKDIGNRINNSTTGPDGKGQTITDKMAANRKRDAEAVAKAWKGAQDWLAEYDRRVKEFSNSAEGKQLSKEFGDAIKEVQAAFDEIKKALGELWNEIVKAFQPLIDMFKPAAAGANDVAGGVNNANGAAQQAAPAFDLIGAIIRVLVTVIRIFVFVIRQFAAGLRTAIAVARIAYSVLRLLIFGPVMLGQAIFKGLADAVGWVVDKVNALIGAVNSAMQPLRDFISTAGQAMGIQPPAAPGAPPTPAKPQSVQLQAGNYVEDKLRTLFTSPLTVNRMGGVSGLKNTPLVKFPQLTPELLDNIAKGAKGGNGTKTVVQTTQVSKGAVQIDATGMNPNELGKVLIEVFEGLNKGKAPKPTT